MNLAQVIRRALLQCNIVRQDGTHPTLLSQDELVGAAQDCMNELTMLQLQSEGEWNVVKRDSDEETSFNFETESYNTSTSLTLAASTREYTLPPDFWKMRRIRAIDTSQQYIPFRHLDLDDPLFVALERDENLTVGTRTLDPLYYTIYGRRTLRFATFPGAAFDIEIFYEGRPATLWLYDGESSNTAALTNGDATVTTSGGTATRWSDSELDVPAVIYFNSTGGTGQPVAMSTTSGSDFIQLGPRRVGSTGIQGPFQIASVTDDTNLEMSRTWAYDTDAAIGYMLCSAPELMETHHQLFVSYLSSYIFDRIGNTEAADRAYGRYEIRKGQLKSDIQRRSTDLEYVEDTQWDDT